MNTNIYMYIFSKYMLYVCVFIYIYYVNKKNILDAINRLAALLLLLLLIYLLIYLFMFCTTIKILANIDKSIIILMSWPITDKWPRLKLYQFIF